MNTTSPTAEHNLKSIVNPLHLVGLALLLACLGWSYWPTITDVANAWSTQPDYSHGCFVLPVAIAFLWIRRDRLPAGAVQPAVVWGLAIVAATILVRYAGARFYFGFIDAWSLILWIAGVVVTLTGWRVLWWSLPSIAFLFFMIPLPYRLEIMFRQPLQHLATTISSAALVMLGTPAIAEGNTIRIGEVQFGIDEACSGLRIFVAIMALAFAYALLVRRHWSIRGLFLLMVVPVALIANATRVIVTCLLYLNVSGEAAQKFSHDFAGFAMIPLAVLLLGLIHWYLGHLFREIKIVSLGQLLRESTGTTTSVRSSAS